MSEIKPVYQIDVAKTGAWFECTSEQFKIIQSGGSELVDFRILYPAAAYEVLKEKLERLNGLYHAEVSKHQLDYNALKAENEAQAKRITQQDQEIKNLRQCLKSYGDNCED